MKTKAAPCINALTSNRTCTNKNCNCNVCKCTVASSCGLVTKGETCNCGTTCNCPGSFHF